jgi:hypothetical protein
MTERPSQSAPGSAVHHQPSHDQLLRELDTSRESTVDAIVVPSARRAESLRQVFELASALDCPALVLCSGDSDPGEAIDIANAYRAKATAVDFRGAELPLALETSQVVSDLPHGAKYHDISLKRNVGLLVAHMTGTWRRVLFLDDDIEIADHSHARAAAAWLSDLDVVGLRIKDFPDNSVVCHASRMAGNDQSTFIGGGALAVRIDELDQFFPDIYNEDWLFIVDAVSTRNAGRLGEATQAAYDPFARTDRAWFQEFGDCIAEGVYARLHVSQEIDESPGRGRGGASRDRAGRLRPVSASLGLGQAAVAEGETAAPGGSAGARGLGRVQPTHERPNPGLPRLSYERTGRDAYRGAGPAHHHRAPGTGHRYYSCGSRNDVG